MSLATPGASGAKLTPKTGMPFDKECLIKAFAMGVNSGAVEGPKSRPKIMGFLPSRFSIKECMSSTSFVVVTGRPRGFNTGNATKRAIARKTHLLSIEDNFCQIFIFHFPYKFFQYQRLSLSLLPSCLNQLQLL